MGSPSLGTLSEPKIVANNGQQAVLQALQELQVLQYLEAILLHTRGAPGAAAVAVLCVLSCWCDCMILFCVGIWTEPILWERECHSINVFVLEGCAENFYRDAPEKTGTLHFWG